MLHTPSCFRFIQRSNTSQSSWHINDQNLMQSSLLLYRIINSTELSLPPPPLSLTLTTLSLHPSPYLPLPPSTSLHSPLPPPLPNPFKPEQLPLTFNWWFCHVVWLYIKQWCVWICDSDHETALFMTLPRQTRVNMCMYEHCPAERREMLICAAYSPGSKSQ